MDCCARTGVRTHPETVVIAGRFGWALLEGAIVPEGVDYGPTVRDCPKLARGRDQLL